jgi:hypothetical protein
MIETRNMDAEEEKDAEEEMDAEDALLPGMESAHTTAEAAPVVERRSKKMVVVQEIGVLTRQMPSKWKEKLTKKKSNKNRLRNLWKERSLLLKKWHLLRRSQNLKTRP